MRIGFLNKDQILDLEMTLSRLAQLTEIERINKDQLEYVQDEIKTLHIKIEVLTLKGMKKNEEHESK